MNQRFLRMLGLSAALMLAAIAGFNALIDPFQMNAWLAIRGLNADKPVAKRYVRLAKAARVEQQEPAAIILGSSRVDNGIDMTAPAWPTDLTPRYNLGVPGMGIDGLQAYMAHAAVSGKLRLVVMGIDFNMFNTRLTGLSRERDFDPRVLRRDERLSWPWMLRAKAETYASLDTLIASWQTIQGQGKGRHEYLASGRFDDAFYRRRAECEGGEREVFAKVQASLLANLERNPAADRLSYHYGDGSSSDDHFRRLLKLARSHQIDLRIFIAPGHLEELRLQHHLGFRDAVRQWKQRLVRNLAQEAAESGQPAYPLWDFSRAHGVIDEPLPSPSDATGSMRWYWDYSHFKSALGDRILNVVLREDGAAQDPGLGRRLTPQTIAQALAEEDTWLEQERQPPVALQARSRAPTRLSGCGP